MHKLMMCVLSCVAFIIPLVYTPGWFPFVFEDQYLIKLSVAEIAVVVIFYALIYSFIKKGELRIRLTPLGGSALLFLLCCFLAIFNSAERMMSAELFFRQFCYTALFLIASQEVCGEEDLGRISFWLLFSVTCAALFGVWQYAHGKEVYATVGNRNFLGSILILVIPLAAVYSVNALRNRRSVLAGGLFLVTALLAGVLYLTKSRGALIALMVSAFSCMEMYLLVKRKRLAALCALLGALIICALIAASPWGAGEMAGDVRLYLWQGTMKMIQDHSFIGAGQGTFFIHFPPYRPTEYFLLPKAAEVTYHPHNEIMSLWVETGIFGALAFICFIGIYAVSFFSQWKKEGRIHPVRGALFAGSIAVFAQSFVDMNLVIPSVAVLFWLTTGTVASGFNRGKVVAWSYVRSARIARIVVGAAASFVLVTAAWLFIIRPVMAQINFGKGSQARTRERWQDVIQRYRKGLVYAPRTVEILYKLAYAYDQCGEYGLAINTYKEIKSIAPYFARIDFNLAVLLDKTGDLPGARESLERWLVLNPYDVNAHRFLADILRRIGDKEGIAQ